MLVKLPLKLCGNCNPHIDAREVMSGIKKAALDSNIELQYLPPDLAEKNILLIISGCPVDCARRPVGEYMQIVVAGRSVNLEACSESEIAAKVVSAVCKT